MFFLLFIPNISVSGILGGPDNYDACIVDRMKGMDKTVIYTVQKSCEREFEVILKPDQKKLIHIAWSTSSSKEIGVEIDKNESDFKVTKATLAFSKTECGNTKDEDFSHIVDVDFSDWIPGRGPKTNTSIKFDNPHEFKCLRTKDLYGKRYR